MVTISKISKPQLNDLVLLAFKDDHDLIDKYHVVNWNLQTSVNDTLSRIDQTSKEYKLTYFKVLVNKIPVGFFVIGDKLLYSFGININYRKKDVLLEWWSLVKQELNNNFIAMLNEKNTRAIEFCQKQGMDILDTTNNIVSLINQ
jgi:hypothetical protein